MIVQIIIILLLLLIIERIVISTKKFYRLSPGKINHVKIKNIDCWLIPDEKQFKITQVGNNVYVGKNKEKLFNGFVYDIPEHASEKFKLLRSDVKLPVNSLCSIWNCYSGVSTGNIFGNWKMISKHIFSNLSICDNCLYVQ